MLRGLTGAVLAAALTAGALGAAAFAAEPAQKSGSPEDHLPANITRLTYFGERPSFSPDGSKIAFMSKSFGDAFVIDLKTRIIRLLTPYPNAGYLRVQYLPNGDYLLIGARKFEDIHKTRFYDEEMWILKAKGDPTPIPLNQKISEGVAISTRRMKIAWANDWRTNPEEFQTGQSAIFTADVVEENGQPKLVDKREVVRAQAPECVLEAQDFRNNDSELIYVCYHQNTKHGVIAEMYGVDLNTGKKTTYRKMPDEYNEVEGIFPDGKYELVESSRDQPAESSKYIDIWRIKIAPDSQDFVRMTRWGDYPGYKASNPVVSPDARYFAFQSGRSGEPAGVGHGIFLYRMK